MLSSLEYFTYLVKHDDSLPLFEAALAIGQDVDADLDLEAHQVSLDIMAARLNRRLPSDASDLQKLRMLNHFFYDELGFAGNVNDYYAADNSYLSRVIHTRRGIPISLAVIYMELADQIGLEVEGISFPGHFLMKLSTPSGDVIIDPFNGESLSRTELEERLEPYLEQHDLPLDVMLAVYLRAAEPRDILARMLRNLKMLYLNQQQWKQLLSVQQRLVILLPEEVAEKRDRGIAYANLDCPQAALADLEYYLSERPHASDAESLKSTLPQLREALRKPH